MRFCCFTSSTIFIVKQNGLMDFEFWKHFSFVNILKKNCKQKNATRIQNINILTHSVWHFSYICDYNSKDSWWNKITRPHFSQNIVSRASLPTQSFMYALVVLTLINSYYDLCLSSSSITSKGPSIDNIPQSREGGQKSQNLLNKLGKMGWRH